MRDYVAPGDLIGLAVDDGVGDAWNVCWLGGLPSGCVATGWQRSNTETDAHFLSHSIGPAEPPVAHGHTSRAEALRAWVPPVLQRPGGQAR